jgi:hypothetical protein
MSGVLVSYSCIPHVMHFHDLTLTLFEGGDKGRDTISRNPLNSELIHINTHPYIRRND